MRRAFSSHSLERIEECVCYRMTAEIGPLVVSPATRHKTDDSTGLAKQVVADLYREMSSCESGCHGGRASWGEANAAMVGAKDTNDDRLVQGKTSVRFEDYEGGRG
jgi:hypothetical protein